MERCSIHDNITLNTTGNVEPWQEPLEDERNWDLAFEIKILALFLYLFLFTFVEFLFNKQLSRDKDLTEQTPTQNEQTETQSDVEDSSTNTEHGLEELEKTTEAKAVTVDDTSAKAVATSVKRKTSTGQRKKEAPKRHLATTDLSNIEPVAKKKYQELKIIIDFHDIRELKQHPGMSLPGADIRNWPSINEIKQQQQKLQPLKNKQIPIEDCESLCSYIHYTDHVLLQRVYNYLQELLQLVGDGCKIIETEHQIIVKVLMVKDAIGLWEKKKLTDGTKDTVCPKSSPKEQSLSLVKSGKKQYEQKPTKLPKEISFLNQNVEKQDQLSPKEKRKELERQFKDARRKVMVKAPKSPTQQVLQDKEDVVKKCVEKEDNEKDEAKCGKAEAKSGRDEAKSEKDEPKPKKHSSKSKKQSAKAKRELAKSKKDLEKDVAAPQNDVCTRDVGTWCHDDNDEHVDKIISQCVKDITGPNLMYFSKNANDIIQDGSENLCKNTEEHEMVYFDSDHQKQKLPSCCCEELCGEDDVYKIAGKALACFCNNLEDSLMFCACKDNDVQDNLCESQIAEEDDKISIYKGPENDVDPNEKPKEPVIVSPSEIPEDQCCSRRGESKNCICETTGDQCKSCPSKNLEQKCKTCSCESKVEYVAYLGGKPGECAICSDKGPEEKSCPFKDAVGEGVKCLCESSQEQRMDCSCRNLAEVLGCCCEEKDDCVDCCCTEEQDMVCNYYNRGLQGGFCPCCKSGEQSMVCSCESPDV